MSEYLIDLIWDSEAAVWIASSDEISGLILESGSLDALIERVKFAVTELLDLNHIIHSDPIRLCFRLEHHEVLTA